MAIALGALLVYCTAAWIGPDAGLIALRPEKLHRLIEAFEPQRLAGRF